MPQLTRLLRYVRPYAWQVVVSVLLMAAGGLMDAFRVLLVGPVFDRVLNPASKSSNIVLFRVPLSSHLVYLQSFVPQRLTSAWNIVAFALLAATLLKGICSYAGTYLVNYAGFGLITDLRNQLYDAILRRSIAFFQRTPTGTLLSTAVNDVDGNVERAGGVSAAVLHPGVHDRSGDRAGAQVFSGSGGVCALYSGVGRQDWKAGAAHYPPRSGQSRRDSEPAP
jgi:ABC-type multidrug transport system fused ATPase/permease subunit